MDFNFEKENIGWVVAGAGALFALVKAKFTKRIELDSYKEKAEFDASLDRRRMEDDILKETNAQLRAYINDHMILLTEQNEENKKVVKGCRETITRLNTTISLLEEKVASQSKKIDELERKCSEITYKYEQAKAELVRVKGVE